VALLAAGVSAAVGQIVGPESMSRSVRIGEVRSGTGLRFTLFAYKVREIGQGKLVCFGGSRRVGRRNLGGTSRCFPMRLAATGVRAESRVMCRARTVFFYGLAGRRVSEVDLLLPAGRRVVASRFPIPRSFRLRGSFFAAAVAEPRSELFGSRGHLSGTPYVSAIVALGRRGHPVAARSADPLPFRPGECLDGPGGF
jgi:hypothetical protein